MNLEKLKESARRFEQKEEWKKAIDVYLKAIAEVESGRDPHPDLAVYNRLGDLYLKTSDTNAAIRAYERAAEMYAEQGFFNNAIALCGKILRLNPQRSPAYLRLAALHARKNVVIEAKRNLLAYMERMHAAGQLDEAFAAVKQQADAFSANAELRMLVVDLLKAASRESEARDDLQRVADGMEAHGDAASAAGRRSGLVEIAVDFDTPLPPRSEAAPPPPPVASPIMPPSSKSGDLVFLDLDAVAAEPTPPPAASPEPLVRTEPRSPEPVAAVPGPLGDLPLIMPDPLDDTPAESLEDVLPSGMAPPPVPVDGRSVLDEPFDGMAVQRLEGIEPTHSEATDVAAAPLEGLEATVTGASSGDVDARVDGLERHDSQSPDEPPIPLLDGLESVEAFDETAADDDEVAEVVDAAPLMDVEFLEEEAEAEASVAEEAVPPDTATSEEAAAVSEPDAPVEELIAAAEAVVTDEAVDEVPTVDAAALEAEIAAWEAAIPGESPSGDVTDVAAPEFEEAQAEASLEDTPLETAPEEIELHAAAPTDEVEEAPADVPFDDEQTEDRVEEAVVLDAEAESSALDARTEADLDVAVEVALDDDASEDAPETEPAEAPAAALHRLIADLEVAVADDPGVPTLHHRLADALLDAGETDRAIDEFAHALIGYESASVLDQAWLLADRLVGMRPDVIRFHQKRVEIAFRIEDRVRLIEAYLALGDALVRANAVDKALAVYRRVLDHDPANREAHGALEAYAPRPVAPPAVTPPPAPVSSAEPEAPADEAAAALPTAVAEDGFIDLGAMILDPEPARDTRMTTAIQPPTGDEQRDFEEALAAFKKGIEENLSDTDYDAHYDLGVAFKEMGLLDEAIAEFQKALRAPDGRLRTSEALGQAFLEKGQVAIAEAVLRRAVESLEGGDDAKVGVLYWLGRAAEAQGRLPEAIAAYERSLAVDIRFADVSERLARLGAGRS